MTVVDASTGFVQENIVMEDRLRLLCMVFGRTIVGDLLRSDDLPYFCRFNIKIQLLP